MTHMVGADNENPLAYLDYSQLLRIIDDSWHLFEHALLEPEAWRGRQHELRQIRHRIGHMRRPHADDLGRLEQSLRDLERGAFITYASYNERYELAFDSPTEHAVVDGWFWGEHRVAQRLLQHAVRRYDVVFSLRSSRRPWAPRSPEFGAGYFWHATFYGPGFDVRGLWRDILRVELLPHLVLLEADSPSMLSFTFSGADDAAEVADAIGVAFDLVLANVSRHERRVSLGGDDEDTIRWQAAMRALDYRVASGEGWTIVSSDTVPITQFGAGGGVSYAPSW